MSQPFTFPPPPPPPPKPVQNGASIPFQSRGGHRGRGNSAPRGRGRGQYSNNSQSRGGYGGHSNDMNSGYGRQQQEARPTDNRGAYGNQNTRPYTGQKREHSVAFQPKSDDALRRSRPLAPPAVPSYGVDFDALLGKTTKSSTSGSAETIQAKANALGLTPQTNGYVSEEEEIDEEAELALKTGTNGALEFEYQGQTSVLKSKEEIASWIAERRKKWPTQDKREQAAKEAEEKRRKWQEEKDSRAKASQAAAKARQEEYLKQKAEKEKSRVRQRLLQEQVKKAKEKAISSAPQTDAETKAERLRRKAERIAKQLEAAEQALLRKQQRADPEDDIDALMNQVDQVAVSQQGAALEIDDDMSVLSSSSEDDLEDTSSSGSSGSDTDMDSDSAPETSSAKRTGPERILAPPRKTAMGASSDTRQPCQRFLKTGQCRYGRKCKYRHDKADRKAMMQKEHGVGNRRKGLYQLLVDKEAEEEKRQALRAIIAIGDAGLLEDPREIPGTVAKS